MKTLAQIALGVFIFCVITQVKTNVGLSKRLIQLEREQKDLRQQFVRAAGMMGEIAFLSHRHHDKAWTIHTNDLRPQLWTNNAVKVSPSNPRR